MNEINEIAIWCAENEGMEGLIASSQGNFMLPLLYSNLQGNPEHIKKLAVSVGNGTRKTVRLKRFVLAEVVEVVAPEELASENP